MVTSNNLKKVKKIIGANEAYYKFLRVPADFAKLMPKEDKRVQIEIDKEKTDLLYLAKYKKLCGFTKWYRKYDVKKGYVVLLEKHKDYYKIIMEDQNE